ncbi:MAG: plasmid stabilization protein [Verrucomicrobiaceae bacterium]|nr:plasmid stabilization protein [Verrucomicrobiaceae bacterium]
MAAKIFSAAQERLIEIWKYTQQTWREEQADKYVRSLWRPSARPKASLIAGGQSWMMLCVAFILSSPAPFHFFRKLSKGALGVISILHENMDLPSRLREDSDRNEDD